MVVIYGTHFKMIISPGIFKIFIFLVVREGGGKRAKNSPNWQKYLSVAFHISGTIHHMTAIYDVHL